MEREEYRMDKMRLVDGDIELTRDEMRVLSVVVKASSIGEAAKKTGSPKKYVLDIVRKLNMYGILAFFPIFSKIGLSLVFIIADKETEKIARRIPHLFLHLSSSGDENIYIALADKKSLPEFQANAFAGTAKSYILGEVRGWNTEVINYLVGKLGVPENFTVNMLSEKLEKYIKEKIPSKAELRRFFGYFRVKEEDTYRKGSVYYVDLDPYDVLLLDSKLADAYASISGIAKRHGLYRQVLHYHYVNHVLPVWRSNIIMWKDVRAPMRPRLLHLKGRDVEVAEEYFRILYPTVFTVRPAGKDDEVFVFTYLPEEREEFLWSLTHAYGLDVAKDGEWELSLSYYASRPFSRIYTGSGWRSIYAEYLRAAGG